MTRSTSSRNLRRARVGAGCVDTGDNATDFSLMNPGTPQNAANPLHLD